MIRGNSKGEGSGHTSVGLSASLAVLKWRGSQAIGTSWAVSSLGY